jgi:hypothetical protein
MARNLLICPICRPTGCGQFFDPRSFLAGKRPLQRRDSLINLQDVFEKPLGERSPGNGRADLAR